MARLKTKRNAKRSRGHACAEVVGTIPSPSESAPRRGVKLKTVSRFTMLFAVICLLAFMAGRPPATPGPGLVAGQRTTAAAHAPRGAFYLGRGLRGAKALSNDTFEIPPYVDQPFYIGFRMGNYELGLAKRTEN